MNLLALLIATLIIFFFANRWYGRGIERLLKVNDEEPTPAVACRDDRDFVPTKPHVLFGHHFATIAGAGPILGPTMAILYGFLPAWLWVIIGGIFFGAVHDFTSLVVSVKEGGRSIAEVTRRTLGKAGFLLFIIFTLLMLYLVCGAFLNAIAVSLTSRWPVEKLGLEPGQHLLREVIGPDGQVYGVIGGIASTSVIVITFLAPLLGFLVYRRGIPVILAYLVAIFIAFGSILIGFRYPVTLDAKTWMIIISVYCLFASALPVWLLLQPRDFTNVQILYGGMLLLAVGVIATGSSGLKVNIPLTNVGEGIQNLGLLWPMLFITIACGAISGFHALVAGGTTAKQVDRQRNIRTIGYGAMLLESVLASLVLFAIAGGLSFIDYKHIVWPSPGAGQSNPVLAFSLSVGHLIQKAFGLPIYVGTIFGILMLEGFIITSLDTAIRFIRYLYEELWAVVWPNGPSFIRLPHFNSALAVLGMWGLAAGNAFSSLWPIFGSANQLLAALTLITLTVWLTVRGLKNWFTLIPALFMSATTIASLLILLFSKYLPQRNWTLVCADIFLLVLAGTLVVVAIHKSWELVQQKRSVIA